jgi:ketosteroid isomerase-like protein
MRNLEVIFSDWLDALRRGDVDRIAARLDPAVVHQGVRPELVCRGRDAVVERVRRMAQQPPDVTAVELIEVGEHVVLSVRASGVGVPEDPEATGDRGQATIVFTLDDGQIVHMQDYLTREAALAAVDAPLGDVWQ